MLSALESHVATLFAEAVLYGLYLATLILCLSRLLYSQNGWKPSHQVDWLMLIMSIAIFMSTTLDTALSVRRAMLTIHQVFGGPAPDLLWSEMTMVCDGTITYIPHLKHSTQSLLVHLQTLFADAVLVPNIISCYYSYSLICTVDVPLLDCLCKIETHCRPARHSLDS